MQSINTKGEINNDIVFQIQLEANHAQLSIEETLRNYAQAQMDICINPTKDAEAMRYRPQSGVETIIIPQFLLNAAYQNSYFSTGFTKANLYVQSPAVYNSVYKFEYYDSNDAAKQIFLFSQVARANGKITYTIQKESLVPSISISALNKNEFNVLYIPRDKVYTEIYLKVSFFNSLTGKTIVFQRENGTSDESNLYIPITLTSDRKYFFRDFAGTSLSLYESKAFSPTKGDDKKDLKTNVRPTVQIERSLFNPLLEDPEITHTT